MFNIFSGFCFVLFVILIIYAFYRFKKGKTILDNPFLQFVDRHYKVILGMIFVVFVFTRFYNLTSVPSTMHIDEASIAYNALNIANYGVDRYTNIFPVYFLNFENGQSAMYTYIAAGLFKIFGYSLFVLRLPAVLFACITLLFGFLIGKEFKGNVFGVLMAIIITICPFFVMTSRWALDCYLMLSFFTVSIYLLIKAIKSGRCLLYSISGLMFGLTLYTYALSYLLIPVILFLIFIYLIYTKKLSLKRVISFCVPLFILACPLIINLMVQQGIVGEIRTRFFSMLKMSSDRAAEISISNVWINLKSIGNYLIYDSIANEKSTFGTMYLFSIPLIIVGIIISIVNVFRNIKKREFNLYTFFVLIFIGGIGSLLFVQYSTTILWKGNALFICLAIFLALGIDFVVRNVKYAYVFVSIVYLLAFGYFMYDYFTLYPSRIYDSSQPMIDYMEALEDANEKDKEIYSVNLDVLKWTNLWAGLALKTEPWFYRENTDHFDKISFYVPDENYDDKIYVVLKERANKLLADDFTCKNYGKIYECYKGE